MCRYIITYISFLLVVIKHDKTEVIQELRSYHCHHPVLLLIDTGSCMNECPELLSTVVRFIREGLLTNTIPIVCSTLDCPHFMVKCINEGAADYVIKPPSEDVIKTLFLVKKKKRQDMRFIKHYIECSKV